MAQGSSGRVVIDLQPEFKQLLHETLRSKGLSLKQWFLGQAEALCEEHLQPPLALGAKGLSSNPASNQKTAAAR
jgi:hypothetical protein